MKPAASLRMKRVTLLLGILLAFGLLIGAFYMHQQREFDKSLSPESTAIFEQKDWKMAVHYSRPYKRSRKIFGALVPYNTPWRTGANEATVFSTNEPIQINGKRLKPGRYHLLTIPHPEKWTIIFNSDIPGWGIEQLTGKTYHNIKADKLVTDARVEDLPESEEQFTIAITQQKESVLLSFRWDQTRVSIPIQRL